MLIPQLLTELQNIRKWIKQDCHILPRQGKIVLKSFLPLKMICQLCQALAKVGCFNAANVTLGVCPGSQLSLRFGTCSGSCLIALPNYSDNIISRLRSSMGLKII